MSQEWNTATDNLRTNPYEMEPQLDPCPFCGQTDKLTLDNLVDSDDYCVECDRCQISQHACFTRDAAIAAWNKRVFGSHL
jgi:Lar family restriction alleviation protein